MVQEAPALGVVQSGVCIVVEPWKERLEEILFYEDEDYEDNGEHKAGEGGEFAEWREREMAEVFICRMMPNMERHF